MSNEANVFSNAPFGYALHRIILDAAGKPVDYAFIEANDTFEAITGLKQSAIIGKTVTEVIPGILNDPFDWIGFYAKVAIEQTTAVFEQFSQHLGRTYKVKAYSPQKHHFITFFNDITEQKMAESHREMTREILQILNEPDDLRLILERVLEVLKAAIGVDALGLRLQEGEDFPFFVHMGFSPEFLATENMLAVRGKDGALSRERDGRVRLECACGLVITGKTDAACPYTTHSGSCWINNASDLPNQRDSQDPRINPRNACIHCGYNSIALVPLLARDRIHGLLHLCDKRKHRFSLTLVECLEGIAAHIGITVQRKLAEDALRVSEMKYRLIADNTSDSVWVMAPDLRFSYLSPSTERMFGYTQEEWNTLDWSEFVHPEDLPLVNQSFERLLNSANVIMPAVVVRVRHKNGRAMWVEFAVSKVVAPDGRPSALVGISRDITERKQAQEALELARAQADAANKAKSEFLANMSHEIRTPMNGVLGFSELLKSTVLDQTQKMYIDHISSSGQNLLRIINDILDLSKIESGKMDLEIIQTDIIELIEQTAELMSFPARKKGLRLLTTIDPAIPRFAMVDPGRLHQILINLLSNAQKFTEKGEIELKATLLNRVGGQGTLRFSVRDTGIGISATQKEKLFKAFSQGDCSTSRKYGGTGLGLVISDQLVQKMGGRLAFESAQGVGSDFFFSIETTLGDGSKIDVERNTATEVIETSQAYKILIAEDNPINMVLASELIRMLMPTAEIIEAVNGKDALDKIVGLQPDLVFMDVQMPDMDGNEATSRLRQHETHEKRSRTVVIGLTAGVLKHERESALESGMDDFLPKPFGIDQLKAILDKYCSVETTFCVPIGSAIRSRMLRVRSRQ